MQNVHGEMIRTDSPAVLHSDVVHQFEMLGVSPAVAQERMLAMTEEERAMLSRDLQSLPAGGDLAYELVFAATGVAIVAGLIALVLVLLKVSRERAEAPAQ